MRQHTSVTIVALLSAGLFLTGCQLFDSSTRQPAPRSASVMSMWELYRHCQSSGDVETVLSAAKQLQQSADTHVVPAPDVPKSLDRFVTRQPVRTTVDPKALAASCTLQAARTSLSAGREQEAEQLLYAVVLSYPESDYTFYVAQARVWIEELHRPGVGPDVVGQCAIGPAMALPEQHGGRTGAPFFGTQVLVAGGAQQEHRPDAPDPAVGGWRLR